MGLTYRRIGMGAKYGRYTHSECSCLGVRCYDAVSADVFYKES